MTLSDALGPDESEWLQAPDYHGAVRGEEEAADLRRAVERGYLDQY